MFKKDGTSFSSLAFIQLLSCRAYIRPLLRGARDFCRASPFIAGVLFLRSLVTTVLVLLELTFMY